VDFKNHEERKEGEKERRKEKKKKKLPETSIFLGKNEKKKAINFFNFLLSH